MPYFATLPVVTPVSHSRPTCTASGLRSVGRILSGAALIAASAQISVQLLGTPVPFTLQTSAVLFVAALSGPRCGVAAVLTYLAAGAAGMPVFSGGRAGVAHLLGPWGGYLIGFVPSAALVGWAQRRTPWVRWVSWGAAFGLTLGLGVAQLTPWLGAATAWQVGGVAFAPVEALKTLAAACAVAAVRRLPQARGIGAKA
jgi:biotin transport system substrate-specific component